LCLSLELGPSSGFDGERGARGTADADSEIGVAEPLRIELADDPHDTVI
jgi:hypothetical protein